MPKVLSWDLTGRAGQNVARIGTENRRFKILDGAKRGRKLIRIALHSRDPHKALEDQFAMISELSDQEYTFLEHMDLVDILRRIHYLTEYG